MAAPNFDDPLLQAAMRAYLDACDAVATSKDDAEILSRSDLKAVAGLQLRKHLAAAGWTAPVSQRTST